MSILTILLSVVVSATIDSTTLCIGDQCDLHLQAVADRQEQLLFPTIGETLIPDIEVVDRTIIDTTQLKDGRVQYDQYLTITSFHDSLFYISPLAFTCGNDTLLTQAMSLNVVQPFEVDTTEAITDIKPIQRAPIWWWGIIRWILLGLLLAALAVGGYFLYRYLRRRYTPAEVIPAEPERPADEEALEALERIRQEKIWQQGQQKQYHTQLTDVVRLYIARRFDVRSTEKTSDETLRLLKPMLNGEADLYARLRQMLQLADLVKFAKFVATPDENEASIQTAFEFVNKTKLADTEN